MFGFCSIPTRMWARGVRSVFQSDAAVADDNGAGWALKVVRCFMQWSRVSAGIDAPLGVRCVVHTGDGSPAGTPGWDSNRPSLGTTSMAPDGAGWRRMGPDGARRLRCHEGGRSPGQPHESAASFRTNNWGSPRASGGESGFAVHRSCGGRRRRGPLLGPTAGSSATRWVRCGRRDR